MASADLLFPVELRGLARELYESVAGLPLISPHGHVDPALLAEDAAFPDPARLIIVPDHYLTRMLASQGVPQTALGVPTLDGTPSETDGRAIWRTFAQHWHLFRGTPSRLWLELVLTDVFGIHTRLGPETADEVYDRISERLAEPEFRPRALFSRFNIEVLTTTESPLDELTSHHKLAADGWGGAGGRVRTTYRPDDVVDMDWAGWSRRVAALGELAGEDTGGYAGYLAALEKRRRVFADAGAFATDHGHPTANTQPLSPTEAGRIFQAGLAGTQTAADAEAFRGHMLYEFARMSTEDGLIMQIHPGAYRNHNPFLHQRHGRDAGADIPRATDYTHHLKPLLDAFGHHPNLRIVLFTLDEDTFTRELAPLAGVYPSLFLGAPWWFLDSAEGMLRFRQSVTETAGFYNTAGFADDTRAFCSIPVRHQVARRVDALYLAQLVTTGRLPLDEAHETLADLAYHLPKRVYRIGDGKLAGELAG